MQENGGRLFEQIDIGVGIDAFEGFSRLGRSNSSFGEGLYHDCGLFVDSLRLASLEIYFVHNKCCCANAALRQPVVARRAE